MPASSINRPGEERSSARPFVGDPRNEGEEEEGGIERDPRKRRRAVDSAGGRRGRGENHKKE